MFPEPLIVQQVHLLFWNNYSSSSYDGPFVSQIILTVRTQNVAVTKPSDTDHRQAIHGCTRLAPEISSPATNPARALALQRPGLGRHITTLINDRLSIIPTATCDGQVAEKYFSSTLKYDASSSAPPLTGSVFTLELRIRTDVVGAVRRVNDRPFSTLVFLFCHGSLDHFSQCEDYFVL